VTPRCSPNLDGPLLEGGVILAQQVRRPRERVSDSWAELTLQNGHHVATQPNPRKGVVVIVRVVPQVKALSLAGGASCRSVDPQERTPVDTPRRLHPTQRPGARSTCQSEQDRLCLVVAGVTEKNDDRSKLSGSPIDGGIPGSAGSSFRAAFTAHLYGSHLHWVESQGGQGDGRLLRDCRRLTLQLMVDYYRCTQPTRRP
jgi:hypothetical protein